jgi:ActR/RegA family two-component response regulator
MAETILLLVPDLFFQARIETAARRMGLRVLKAVTWKAALEVSKKTPPAGVVIDLGAPAAAGPFKFLEKRKSDRALSGMRTLGFLDHVRADLADRARKAGCSTVVSKNALSLDTDGYLRRLTGPVVPLAPARPEKAPPVPAEEE